MSRFDIRLGGMLLISALFLLIPVSGNGLVPLREYRDGFNDPFYQTTTWKEVDTPLEFWYAEASSGSGFSLEEFNWSVNLTETYSAYGGYSVELFMDGRFGEGVVWLERKFKLTETLPYITLRGRIYKHENFTKNWQVLIYIGTEDPVNEAGLRGPNNEGAEILREWYPNDWALYSRTNNTTFHADTIVYLAFGISIISEYNRTDSIYLDLLEIWSVGYDWYIRQNTAISSYTRQNTSGFLFIGVFVALLALSITITVKKKNNFNR
ncbi:MAG: hypothetical protein ACFFC7_03595 [Candidatus Hermodarchaeota archaeon]